MTSPVEGSSPSFWRRTCASSAFTFPAAARQLALGASRVPRWARHGGAEAGRRTSHGGHLGRAVGQRGLPYVLAEGLSWAG
jgi:hypothetical protein